MAPDDRAEPGGSPGAEPPRMQVGSAGHDADRPGNLRGRASEDPAVGRGRLVAVLATLLAVALGVGVVVVTSRPDPAPVEANGLAPLPEVPLRAVGERWTRPVDRALHDLLVVGEQVVVVEQAPLRQGVAPGVLVSALDVEDGRRRWQRRVPGRSLVVLAGDDGEALVDVAASFNLPSTLRGLSLADGHQTWTRPAFGARRVAWGPDGTVLFAGEGCTAVDPVDGTIPPLAQLRIAACSRLGPLISSTARMDVSDQSFVVDVEPDSATGSAVRVAVRAHDDRSEVAGLRGSGDVVLDLVDDQPLGGQLTTGGLLVPGDEDRPETMTLHRLPDLAPRWSVTVVVPVARVASGHAGVVVAAETPDGRLILHWFA